MKKLTYLLGLLLVGGLIFSSCSKDEEEAGPPTIAFVMNYDTTITVGDSILVSVTCAANSVSGTKLDKYQAYTISNNEVSDIIDVEIEIGETTYTSSYWFTFTYVMDGKFYAKIVDEDGLSSEVSFNITVEEATTPLEGEQDLEWQRVAGAAGTNLDMFGLKWTSNVKEVMAVIQKDSADKFVQLTTEDWANITTKEDLMAAVEAADDLGDEGYRGVSAEADGTYDDVIATKFGEEYFIMHITEGTVDVDPVAGTTITINGQYNK